MMLAPITVEAAAPVQADLQAQYESAVAKRLAGRFEEAARGLERILAADPQHVDARLNLGLVRLAQGRLAEAEKELRLVLAAAPHYADAREGLVAVDRRRAAARAGRVDLDYARSSLSADLPDWTELRLSATRSLGEAWSLGGTLEYTERFRNKDIYAEGRVDRRLQHGAAYLALGGAPDADYRPETQARAGGEVPIHGGFAVSLDAAAARYASGVVTTLQPGAAATLLNGRLELRARWINTWDEDSRYRAGYALTASMSVTTSVRLRLGYADAPEASEGITVDVKARSVGLEFALDKATLLRIGGAFEDRGAYDRQEVSVGLGRRF